jgi:ribonuclease P protein component
MDVGMTHVFLLVYAMPTFIRNERLKSAKAIGQLFKGGNSYVAYPLRVVWMPQTEPLPDASAVQVMFAAPKRSFKTAVLRNLLKRRMREAYRLHKAELYAKIPADHPPLALMLMYIAKEELPYSEIESGMRKMVRKFELPAK